MSAVNLAGARTLFNKEILRFWKVSVQTVAAPVLTAVLYLLIFGHVLEAHVLKPVHQRSPAVIATAERKLLFEHLFIPPFHDENPGPRRHCGIVGADLSGQRSCCQER